MSHEQNSALSTVSEAERVAARMKSYVGPAILVFALYWVFWLPGLIANYVYWQEAKRMERIAGQSLPGRGCLGTLFWINAVIGGIALIGLIAFIVSVSTY